jgi:hypothetical protein
MRTGSFWLAVAAVVTSAAAMVPTPHGVLLEVATIVLIISLRYVARWGH